MNILCKNKETFSGSVFFLFSLYVLWETSKFVTPAETVRSLGPEVFPNILALSLCALSISLFIQGLRLPASPIISTKLHGKAAYPAAVITLGCCSFMFLIDFLGFFIWSILFLIILQYAIGERRIVKNLLISLMFSFCIYFIFSVGLGVPMPRGPLPF